MFFPKNVKFSSNWLNHYISSFSRPFTTRVFRNANRKNQNILFFFSVFWLTALFCLPKTSDCIYPICIPLLTFFLLIVVAGQKGYFLDGVGTCDSTSYSGTVITIGVLHNDRPLWSSVIRKVLWQKI